MYDYKKKHNTEVKKFLKKQEIQYSQEIICSKFIQMARFTQTFCTKHVYHLSYIVIDLR